MQELHMWNLLILGTDKTIMALSTQASSTGKPQQKIQVIIVLTWMTHSKKMNYDYYRIIILN